MACGRSSSAHTHQGGSRISCKVHQQGTGVEGPLRKGSGQCGDENDAVWCVRCMDRHDTNILNSIAPNHIVLQNTTSHHTTHLLITPRSVIEYVLHCKLLLSLRLITSAQISEALIHPFLTCHYLSIPSIRLYVTRRKRELPTVQHRGCTTSPLNAPMSKAFLLQETVYWAMHVRHW